MVNGGELELRDAILIDVSAEPRRRERWLGTIAAGATVEIDEDRTGCEPPERVESGPGPDAEPVLGRTAHELGTARRKPG